MAVTSSQGTSTYTADRTYADYTYVSSGTCGTASTELVWETWNVGSNDTSERRIVHEAFGHRYIQADPEVDVSRWAFMPPPTISFIPDPEPQGSSTVQKEADRRAKDLLKSCLSEAQSAMFEAEKKFIAISGERRFIVKPNAMIEEIDDNNHKICRWCIDSNEGVPIWDAMLAKKLMIENSLGQFLAIARHHNF